MERRILLAITLSSVIPFLGLIYLVQDPLATAVLTPGPTRFLLLVGLLLGTACSAAIGAYLVWDIAQAGEAAPAEGRRQGDEVVAGMLGTMGQQASEIKDLTERLDAAYQELGLANAKLKKFSFKDEVTELYNRRFFLLRLEEEISRYRRFAHPVSVVLFDLDGFKDVNDDLGHDAGDETLREVGQLLTLQSRDINVVARYGGDEFAMLLVETSKAGAHVYAERIREVVAAHAFGHGRHLTASLGVASLPEDEMSTAGDVLRAADRALYAAKRAGKNRVAVLEAPRPTG